MRKIKILTIGFLLSAAIFTIFFYTKKASPLPQDTDVVVPSEASAALSPETVSGENLKSDFPEDIITTFPIL